MESKLMVVTGGGRVRALAGEAQHVTAGRDPALEVQPEAQATAGPAMATGSAPRVSEEFVLADPVGGGYAYRIIEKADMVKK